METKINPVLTDVILNSLNDGLYVCDLERTILYWSKAAERITGWTSEEVVGHKCSDNILVHIDKDGRELCGEEFCPLYRCMHTNKSSTESVLIFGKTNVGDRVAMTVSVAPIHDEQNDVIGGVETFRDYSHAYTDLLRAKRIQELSMDHESPQDMRVSFRSFYLPHGIIGGDYFAFRQLDADRYGFMLADVMGHGVAAALYTMHLSSLWERHHQKLMQPFEFAKALNRELCKIVKDESFSTALCGVLNAADRSVRFTSAGGPPMIRFKSSGMNEAIKVPGLPFGLSDDADYEESIFQCDPGDSLLLCSDGALEIEDAKGQQLGTTGLIHILESLGYPGTPINIESLHQALLSASNEIRINDDLTLLEIRVN
ncbi:MAG: SpoIIE family protein phosphatase [Deltaproteobacteria bacterium]|nr:SpoIIE family protein phosphatase [Deltaproteobacteria bacterium]